MSARSLRKVLEEQERQGKGRRLLSSSGDESDSASASPSSSFTNPFDLLDDQNLESESDVADESSIVYNRVKEQSGLKANIATFGHKSKKKKKKKSPEELSSSTEHGISLEDTFDKLSLGVESTHQDRVLKGKPNVGNTAMKESASSVLQVHPRFLSAEKELRKIFGSKVVNSFERSRHAGSSRQGRGGRRGSYNHRKTILVSPAEHWPRWDGSLSMELLESRGRYNHFMYVYSSSYSQAQQAFEAAKAIHDLNGIASILIHHPYHIDSLRALAEYFSFSGEHQMSADATAKCLYAMECAWHPLFTPLQGNCQLKYTHETNKLLFSTLFTHMRNMDRRGCHRAALEICKLLLSLDSDDPMGSLFCIDYFALRAEEYMWLEQFSELYRSDSSLWLYPNFSFSLAICRFCLERMACKKVEDRESGKATSSDLMKQALMLHPSVLRALVVKVPMKDQVWPKLTNYSLFASDKTGSPSLDHLINIYVERSYIIWRLPDLQNLLRETAVAVIEKLENNRSDANDWACVRKEAFSCVKNEFSHLLVSDFSDAVPTIPPEILQNLAIEPRMIEMQNANQVNPPGDAHAPRDVTNRNALAVLFESMLPWIDYGRREDGEEHDDNHVQQN